MASITWQAVVGILTLAFAYLGWRASAIPGETDRIRNVRERFGETANVTPFYSFRLLRVEVVEKEGFLMRTAKYVPRFPYQARTSVYLRFESYPDHQLPKIASVNQITNHPDYNEDYYIGRMIVNEYSRPSIDITLVIETGDPKRIHGSIQHLSAILQDLGEQNTPPEHNYHNPDYSWSLDNEGDITSENTE